MNTRVFISIIMISLFLITSCGSDNFGKANREFNDLYFDLCKSVITDTKEISKRTAYETVKLLQSDESVSKLQKMRELIEVMEKSESSKDIYSSVRKWSNEYYERVIKIKNSYPKWEQLTEEQMFEILGEYQTMSILYGVEAQNRKK